MRSGRWTIRTVHEPQSVGTDMISIRNRDDTTDGTVRLGLLKATDDVQSLTPGRGLVVQNASGGTCRRIGITEDGAAIRLDAVPCP